MCVGEGLLSGDKGGQPGGRKLFNFMINKQLDYET